MGLTVGIAADQRLDPVQLHRIDNGPDVDALVQRIARAQFRHPGLEPRVEILGDPLLHQEARARATDLTLVEPDRIDKALDR